MEQTQEQHLKVTVQGEKEATSPEILRDGSLQSSVSVSKQYQRWLVMVILAILVLFGQSAATLLGRLYYDKGGKSNWLSALIQVVGFPLLLPFMYFTANKRQSADEQEYTPSPFVLGSIYVVLGTLLAAVGMLFSIGLLHLPVSTFALISASQLGFNALFSFFLNSLKFTPFIVNSLVLLATSSALLVVHTDPSGSKKSSQGKYIIGFLCTVIAAALYALILSLSQLAFNKILKKQTVKEVVDFLIYESLVASCILTIGLFASGEWNALTAEMNEFRLGKTSYVMTVLGIALCWQVFSIGMIGLILKVSSLFANVISTLSLPSVPILAVFIFNDKMSGVKAVSLFLALWGFVSYMYQHYIDGLKAKAKAKVVSDMSEISLVQG